MDFTHHALGLVEACESIQEEKGPTAQYLIKFYRGISGLKTGHSSLPSFGQGGKEMKEATCHRLIEDLISCQILRVYTEIGPYGQVMAFLRVNKMSSHYMNLRRGQCRFCLKTRSKSGWAKTNEDNLANKTSNRMEREDPIPSVESKSNNNQSSEVLKPLVDYLLQSRKQWLQKQPNNDNIPLTYVLTSEEAYEIAKQCPSDTTTLRNCLSRKFALDRFADDILHALTLYK